MHRPLWTYKQIDDKLVQKLKNKGFYSKADVLKNADIAEKIDKNIRNAIIGDLNEETDGAKCGAWSNGLDLMKIEEAERVCVSTLVKSLDQLLNGGVELGKLTEVHGNCGAGKTQLCLQLAVNVCLPKQLGGLEGESVYIETSKCVYTNRLDEMIEAFVRCVTLNMELAEQTKAKEWEIEDMKQELEDVMHDKDMVDRIEKENKSLWKEHARKPVQLEEQGIGIAKGIKENSSVTNDAGTETGNVKITEEGKEVVDESKEKDESTHKEYKIKMTRNDLKQMLSKSKKLNTNINEYLIEKRNSKPTVHETRRTITNASDVTAELIRSSVHVHYCANLYETIALIANVEKYIQSNESGSIRLIVIDNITYLFHNEEDRNYLKRTKLIYFLLNMLDELARKYSLGVLIVNQLTTKITDDKRSVIPALGETFGHRINTRLFLQRLNFERLCGLGECEEMEDEGQFFSCSLDKMCLQNEELASKSCAVFKINEEGVRDV